MFLATFSLQAKWFASTIILVGSSEWTDWHLTPRGWIEGSAKSDSARKTVVQPPDDRVLTVRIGEDMDHRMHFSKVEREVWPEPSARDEAGIARLKKKFGSRPGEARHR